MPDDDDLSTIWGRAMMAGLPAYVVAIALFPIGWFLFSTIGGLAAVFIYATLITLVGAAWIWRDELRMRLSKRPHDHGTT